MPSPAHPSNRQWQRKARGLTVLGFLYALTLVLLILGIIIGATPASADPGRFGTTGAVTSEKWSTAPLIVYDDRAGGRAVLRAGQGDPFRDVDRYCIPPGATGRIYGLVTKGPGCHAMPNGVHYRILVRWA